MSSDFWAEHTQPVEPAQPMSLGEQYRSYQASKSAGGSGSMMYSLPTAPEQRAAAAATMKKIYEARNYRGLESYTDKQRDPLDARPGESPEAHRRRVIQVGRHLEEGELERRLAEIDEGAATHEELRAQIDGRTSGTGIGLMGSPQERAGLVGRWGGRQPEANGHATVEPISSGRPLSMVEVNAAIRANEEAARGQQPQHPEIPTGSSGTGIFVR